MILKLQSVKLVLAIGFGCLFPSKSVADRLNLVDYAGPRNPQCDRFGVSQLVPSGEITLKGGRVEQRNFDRYQPPYIAETPVTVDVHIVASSEQPTGCGEPPVPVISPAVVNALARLTGKRYRRLPLTTI